MPFSTIPEAIADIHAALKARTLTCRGLVQMYLDRIEAYDRRRAAIHPHKPRDPVRWGIAEFYGWSEDKARQYGVPQRADFGAYVRKQGFRLD